MVKKIKGGGDIAKVPEWVKTEEDLEKFANEYAGRVFEIMYLVVVYIRLPPEKQNKIKEIMKRC